MPGPPASTKSGSGRLRVLMAGTTATRSTICRPRGAAGFSGTASRPHCGLDERQIEGLCRSQGDSGNGAWARRPGRPRGRTGLAGKSGSQTEKQQCGAQAHWDQRISHPLRR